jgi:hypothetical protein
MIPDVIFGLTQREYPGLFHFVNFSHLLFKVDFQTNRGQAR